MKVTVYGAGNQKLYIENLNLPEKYGGEAPYGGSRMAIEFAEAGHEVTLAEPAREILDDDHWNLVEEAGVTVSEDDAEAAREAEVAVLFTPFGKKTFEIAKNILPELPENAVIANTCTVSPVVLYYVLEKELRMERRDIGIASMHPAAVPGTPQHEHYVIGGHATSDLDIATDEQIARCVELAESSGKKAYVVPADVSSAVADMGSLVTAVALSGVLDYYYVGTKIIGAPEEMVEKQILMTLQTMASLVETSGVRGMARAMNPELLVKSAKSMHLLEEQEELDAALRKLSDLNEDVMKWIEGAGVNHTDLVAAQALTSELKTVMGERAAEGTIRRCMRKMFE
ncbi:H(2)-dependent methylenetetrahydromethanopterin dehydrogenase-related protein [Methanothermobacter wolfeii]|uniref:5,10-methenyltetrahydromethanopterin hydrogenase n=1 Tax=Methanothermobacter wolfeii TaxID=145261 RepID=A0ABU8TTX5_METWO